VALAAQLGCGFTAAYFDHAGLYAFGRQAEAIRWNCGQLAVALRPMAETAPLVAALERFEPLFQQRLAMRVLWRLGVDRGRKPMRHCSTRPARL
jgi:uncharacterized protein YdiU (UPF0061 family)